jgi:mannose-6-phosphate isomerase-like protein (cupin superfamily)
MKSYDVDQMRAAFRELDRRAYESLGTFDSTSLGIGRYVPGSSPWERHNNGDELLYIVDGEVDIEVLGGDEPFKATLRQGALFVVPRGRWHQLTAHAMVNIVFSSPSEDGAERVRERPSST